MITKRGISKAMPKTSSIRVMKREEVAELDQVVDVGRGEADEDRDALGQHVVADGDAGEEERAGDGREDPRPLPLAGVQAGHDEGPDLVEPERAGRDHRDHAAQLELQQQRPGDAVDARLGVDVLPSWRAASL